MAGKNIAIYSEDIAGLALNQIEHYIFKNAPMLCLERSSFKTGSDSTTVRWNDSFVVITEVNEAVKLLDYDAAFFYTPIISIGPRTIFKNLSEMLDYILYNLGRADVILKEVETKLYQKLNIPRTKLQAGLTDDERRYCEMDIKTTKEMSDFYSKQLLAYFNYFENGGADMRIEKVIFNNPATIVLWRDGTKTVVKAQDGELFDPEKGLAMAVAKKALGTNKSKSNFNDIFKKWLPKEEKKEPVIIGGVDVIDTDKNGLKIAVNFAPTKAASEIKQIILDGLSVMDSGLVAED